MPGVSEVFSDRGAHGQGLASLAGSSIDQSLMIVLPRA